MILLKNSWPKPARLRFVLFAAVLLELTGCGHLTIYDREICADLGKYGAQCAHTLTDGTREVPKEAWDRERVGMLCMSSQAYTDTETAIDQACVELRCDYRTREELRRALERVRPVVDQAEAVRSELRQAEAR
jgi:hypothetical protein